MEHQVTKIGTRLGGHFDYSQPEAYDPDIREIAFALSGLCRFTGHIQFYSVAQHSVIVSRMVPHEHAFAALMHDAHEAYMGDVNGPLKSLLPDYRALEKRVATAIRSRFGLPPTLPSIIDVVDKSLTLTEAIRFGIPARDFPASIKPLDVKIEPQSRELSARAFLQRYWELATDQGALASVS